MSRGGPETGMSLVALLASITIMMIVMGAAMPSWRYVMKDMREEELFFRGDQIASAIERFQRKNGNALPTSLDVLVKGKFLRKAYPEPMSKHGKWRLVMQGEPIGAPGPMSRSRGGGLTRSGSEEGGKEPEPTPRPPSASPPPQTVGPIIGVASTSTEKSLRLMNGRERYDQWLFIAGQPRAIGRLEMKPVPSLPGAPGAPGAPGPPANPPPAR